MSAGGFYLENMPKHYLLSLVEKKLKKVIFLLKNKCRSGGGGGAAAATASHHGCRVNEMLELALTQRPPT